MNHYRDVLMRIPFMLFWAIVVSATIFMFQYMFYTFTPRSWYFNWYAERVVVAKVGEPLEFTSNRDVHETFPIEYIDIVTCGDKKLAAKDEKVFQVNKVQKDNEKYLNATQGFTINGFTPMAPREGCRLDSKIIMHLPYGIQKVQDISTEPFDIKE